MDGKVKPLLFATVAALAAFLAMVIQPMLGKALLAPYGGVPAVWLTCLFYFQIMVLGGYGLAHALVVRFRGPAQAIVPALLAATAFAVLPPHPDPAFVPDPTVSPVWSLLGLLVRTSGLPLLALGASGPLVQAWANRAGTPARPWVLFAVSNGAAILALVAYPVILEPMVPGSDLAGVWSLGYGIFVVLLAGACLAGRSGATSSPLTTAVPGRALVTWVLGSALGVVILMATTQRMTQDVASAPFLWILPLVLYLLSFVVTFAGQRGYAPRAAPGALILAILIILVVGESGPQLGPFRRPVPPSLVRIVLLAGGMFLSVWVAHGELYRRRPPAEKLTSYYLALAGGGVLGGAFVVLAAPFLFPSFGELHLAVAAVWILALAGRNRAAAFAVPIAYLALVLFATPDPPGEVLHRERNFAGGLRVMRPPVEDARADHLVLFSGTTKHGVQYLDPGKRRLPTTYYSPFSGLGATLAAMILERGDRVPMKIGAVGLGVGTLAAYGRSGDRITFFELDPAVIRLARGAALGPDPNLRFTFLADSPAEIITMPGDGRTSLAAMLTDDPAGQAYDLIVLDAFSGDAIPVHLLTAEAMDLYAAHLASGGVLLFHVTNRHLDLEPVLVAQARRLGWEIVVMRNGSRGFAGEPEERWQLSTRATWIALAPDGEFGRELDEAIGRNVSLADLHIDRDDGRSATIRPWTDDRSDLFTRLRRGPARPGS